MLKLSSNFLNALVGLGVLGMGFVASDANAGERPMLPAELTGTWCEVGKSRGSNDTLYNKAKTACRADRPSVFTINPLGFWIKLARVKSAQIMCAPIAIKKVENRIWDVTADCGADNNSTPIYRIGYTFALGDQLFISRGDGAQQ